MWRVSWNVGFTESCLWIISERRKGRLVTRAYPELQPTQQEAQLFGLLSMYQNLELMFWYFYYISTMITGSPLQWGRLSAWLHLIDVKTLLLLQISQQHLANLGHSVNILNNLWTAPVLRHHFQWIDIIVILSQDCWVFVSHSIVQTHDQGAWEGIRRAISHHYSITIGFWSIMGPLKYVKRTIIA